MINRQDIYKNYFTDKDTCEIVSINDLRDKEFRNKKLSKEESQAILNFDRFRLEELNKIKDDFSFNTRYRELQVMANLTDYKEFLKEDFFFSELL